MKRGIWESFQGLDGEADIQPFVQYLDRLRELASQQDQEQQDLSGFTLRSGDKVLDVGCGVGHETQNLARLVGPSGKTYGVDLSAAILEEARRRAKSAGLEIEFQKADIYHLPFVDNFFDYCRADRVFIYLDQPRKALAEISRVIRPGGVFFVNDPDLDSIILDAPDLDRALTRRFVHFFSDNFPGIRGRELGRRLKTAGYDDIRLIPKTFVYQKYQDIDLLIDLEHSLDLMVGAKEASRSEADHWLAGLRQGSASGTLTFALSSWAAFARKRL